MKRWIALPLALVLALHVGCASGGETGESVSSGLPLQSQPESAVFPEEQEPAKAMPSIPDPILLTSFGQSADGLLMREILTDLGADFTYLPSAEPEILPDYRAVFLAVGASTKALSASGIESEEEYSRAQRLLEALDGECMVVMIRLGDSSGQDSLTDRLISLTQPYADLILVTKNGDRDGGLARYASQNQIACFLCEDPREMKDLLGELLSKPSSES